MIRLWLIRHGQTPGNRVGRYIGTTDESLSESGRSFLEKLNYPKPDAVYVSPMRRCTETADILFPGMAMRIIEELSECDFGDFENKNYKELSGNEDYQRWIDSQGTLPFPNGESREAFRYRSQKGFQLAAASCIRHEYKSAALVIHGGTIMNIMEDYADRERAFYDWHVGNGGGFEVELDPKLWTSGRRELILCSSVLDDYRKNG